MSKTLIALLAVTVLCPGTTLTAEQHTDKKVTVADLDWLEGTWRGEAFGGIAEDIWDRPWDGSIVGTFKLSVDGQPKFYEFFAVINTENGPAMRLKHFHPDVTGWEGQNDYVEFPFVSAGPNRIQFDGLSYELVGEDTLVARVDLGHSGGETETVEIRYGRVK